MGFQDRLLLPNLAPGAPFLILISVVGLAVWLRRAPGRTAWARRLVSTWLRVGFEDPPAVQRLLVRGTVAGALAGALGASVGHAVHRAVDGAEAVWSTPSPDVFAVSFAAAVLLLVLPQRHTVGTLLAVAPLLLFLAWTPSSMPYFFTVSLGLALALEPASAPRRIVALTGPVLAAAWCLLLSRHPFDDAAPLAFDLVNPLASGLFLSVGAILARVSFAADSVEPKLVGQPKLWLTWRRLRSALQRLPAGEARAQLDALSFDRAARCLSALAERDALASSMDEAFEQEVRAGAEALRQRLAGRPDPELAPHLAQLLRMRQDALEHFDGLHRKLERLDARAAAEAGWLETAAFTVELAPREIDPGALATRLRSLAPGLVSNRRD